MVLSVVFLVVYSWEILSRTYIALCETGVSTSGSPFSYCQPLAVVYKMLWAAVRIALTEVADLSVMWLVILVVASIESLPLRIS